MSYRTLSSLGMLSIVALSAGCAGKEPPADTTTAGTLDRTVLPIDDRRSERFNPAIAGRPDCSAGLPR